MKNRKCTLATSAERFSSTDVPVCSSPGEALRVLSTHPERQKRALIWLQRHYITAMFPNYDPTSTRDDDLPFDLDHAIPQSLFGFHGNAKDRVVLSKNDEVLRFLQMRGTVGNSLGNLRWLAAADNRRRGMRSIEDEPSKGSVQPTVDDHICRPSWNKLIPAEGPTRTWTEADVTAFQHLIDSRTLSLINTLMVESGITKLINTADFHSTPPLIPSSV